MKKKIQKKPVKKVATAVKRKTKTLSTLSREEFLEESEKISTLLRELKSEMTARFEKHENIILAEYRHRIESLEDKVRTLSQN